LVGDVSALTTSWSPITTSMRSLYRPKRIVKLAVCLAADCSTSCDYLNGTSGGQKCVGTRACYGIDPTNVGCGSCNGGWACSSVKQRSLTVGEKSCIGRNACYAGLSTTAITIGNDSCVGSSLPTEFPKSCGWGTFASSILHFHCHPWFLTMITFHFF
jgi:hypothetical protein